jgi:phospholipase C
VKRPRFYYWIGLIVAAIAFGGCGGGSSLPQSLGLAKHKKSGSTPIQHVVIMIQENRSFDNFFATFPGARGATRGKEKVMKNGKYVDKWIPLKPQPLTYNGQSDLEHCREAYLAAYDGGKMDGFNLETVNPCGSGAHAGTRPYHYVTPSQIQPYWDVANQWVLADGMFQTQGSGSFTAHQDLIRGGSCIQACSPGSLGATTRTIVDNPTYWPWGCDAGSSVVTHTVDIYGVEREDGPFPCSNKFADYTQYATLGTLLDNSGVSWKYYTPCFSSDPKVQPGCSPSSDCSGTKPNCNGSLMNAFDVIYPVRYGPEWGTNVSWPETNIFTDIGNSTLPKVSWVIPEDANSDHPKQPCKCDNGPSWVASVINAVGESKYWDSTVIIVVWDDWGGFYDNAVPPFTDQFGGLGFRVPMLVVSPYDIAGTGSAGGYISHTQYEFGSILAYIEQNWNLGTLGTSDSRANSIGDMFNYGQSPRQFTAIPSKYSPKYFMSHSHTTQRGDTE